MKILALDLSSGRGSVAFCAGDETPFATTFANDRKDSGQFFDQLRQTLAAHGQPERIVVGLGPGSYAGTRIAISAAIGLEVATGAELVGLPSICAMKTEAIDYMVIGDARRQTFFFAQVSGRVCVTGPTLCREDELRERLTEITMPVFTTELLPAFASATVAHPSASILAQLAAGEHDDFRREPLEPLYLREAHITQPKSGMIPQR
ncbi:MAG: tRNA (adenosine(37)-N6)-threonylcarbamoyltransferase complex dimerization subunit type 1 TsaB [Chthoniobacterales bacterium]